MPARLVDYKSPGCSKKEKKWKELMEDELLVSSIFSCSCSPARVSLTRVCKSLYGDTAVRLVLSSTTTK